MLAAPAAASLATIMVCGLTSSVHYYKGVPWVAGANLLALAACGAAWRRQVRWRRLVAVSAGMACLAFAGLWVFRTAVSNEYASTVTMGQNGVVRLGKKQAGETSETSGRVLAVLCDREQLGRLYGKRLREMLALVDYDAFVIPDPRRLLPAPETWLPVACDVAVFGRSAALLDRVPVAKGRTCYFAHPEGEWREWAAKHPLVRKIAWLPLYDSEHGRQSGRGPEGGEMIEMIEYRMSASLGGACSARVIQQAKGFFW